MNLVTPDFGLLFWQTFVFLTVLFLLAKFAWKPIMQALEERENVIAGALNAAEQAKEEMKKLQATNEKLLQEARQERDKLMKDAQTAAAGIVAEAKDKATEEADRIIYNAKALIETEKQAALAEVKNTAAFLSLEIAEKLLKKNLSGDDSQKALVNEYIKDAKLN
jgi:F-type H+-transporting ATPase subunit b